MRRPQPSKNQRTDAESTRGPLRKTASGGAQRGIARATTSSGEPPTNSRAAIVNAGRCAKAFRTRSAPSSSPASARAWSGRWAARSEVIPAASSSSKVSRRSSLAAASVTARCRVWADRRVSSWSVMVDSGHRYTSPDPASCSGWRNGRRSTPWYLAILRSGK